MPSNTVYGHYVYIPGLTKGIDTRHVKFTGEYYFSKDLSPPEDLSIFDKVIEAYFPLEEWTDSSNPSVTQSETPSDELAIPPRIAEDDVEMITPPEADVLPETTVRVHDTAPDFMEESGDPPDTRVPPDNQVYVPIHHNPLTISGDALPHSVIPQRAETGIPTPPSLSQTQPATVQVPANLRSDIVGASPTIQMPSGDISSRLRTRVHTRLANSEGDKRFRIQYVSANILAVRAQPAISNEEKAHVRQTELAAHERLGTWYSEPVTVTPVIQEKSIPSVWLYTRKPTGIVKARLVARGDRQTPSTFSETFSPTLSHECFRAVLAITAANCWSLFQVDVNTAFLNAYMKKFSWYFPALKRLPTVCGRPSMA